MNVLSADKKTKGGLIMMKTKEEIEVRLGILENTGSNEWEAHNVSVEFPLGLKVR